MEKPFDAQVERHDETVIWSLAKLYPVNARAALSDTQPTPAQPSGTPVLEAAALELVVLAECADVTLAAADEEACTVEEAETGTAMLAVVDGLAAEDTDDDDDEAGTPEDVRRVSRAGPPQISFSAQQIHDQRRSNFISRAEISTHRCLRSGCCRGSR